MNRIFMSAILCIAIAFVTTMNVMAKKPVTATPAQTSATSNKWGKVIVHHQSKPGVYEEFYSADFGVAGRWMTTNLTAKAYDTNLPQNEYHTGGRTLSGPIANPGDPYNLPCNTAYWTYPKADSPVIEGEPASAEFITNPALGLLYTWDAATAGKGGPSGMLNMDNPAEGHPANGENGMAEWNGKGVRPENTQKRNQGVCPAGWHLPSDYEWTELEREIIRNTGKYANQPNIDKAELNRVFQNDTTGYRGSSTGNAIKNVAQHVNDPAYRGTSKAADENGFDALFAGMASTGVINEFGSKGCFWTSSSTKSNVAWYRYVDGNDGGVFRNAIYRVRMLSVRCKKD